MITPDEKDTFSTAERYLNTLAKSAGGPFTFQTFDDGPGRRQELTKIFHGTLSDHLQGLLALNRRGAGIFVTVNETDLKGRATKNIVRVRSLFVDSDKGPLPEVPLPPSIRVITKKGEHAYWLVNELSLERFNDAQKMLIRHLGTDPVVKDLPRVMRLPGFMHMKDPQNPFFVHLASSEQTSYTMEEILAAFRSPLDRDQNRHTPSTLDQFRNWAASLPAEQGNENSLGGRNCAVLNIVREGLARELSENELESVVLDYCQRSQLPLSEAMDIVRRQRSAHMKKAFLSFHSRKPPKPVDLAEMYLNESELRVDGILRFRWYRGDFYRWNERYYEQVPLADMKAEIMAWIQSQPDVRRQAGSRITKEVVANLEGIVKVPSKLEIPIFLDGSTEKPKDCIALANGLLLLNDHRGDTPASLMPHTSTFLNFGCLPYTYDPEAKCPAWVKFLSEVQPDPEIRELLQEWFGYNLIFDTSQERFMLFVGDGANGKSVCCVVLRELLGEENVSAVSLEAFNPQRTFPLAATFGKLANIVEEIGEVDKASEGLLKQFVSGGHTTIERKYRDAFSLNPTARITFATNVLPKFTDRSDGLWRRVLLVPFQTKIPEERQNKNLRKAAWWRSSGELSGIFNWALEGLVRLKARGQFKEPSVGRIARNNYKRDTNPAMQFLQDHCQQEDGATTLSREIYSSYRAYAEAGGNRPLAEVQFSLEVRRAFAQAELTPNAVHLSGKRGRAWRGVKLLDSLSHNF